MGQGSAASRAVPGGEIAVWSNAETRRAKSEGAKLVSAMCRAGAGLIAVAAVWLISTAAQSRGDVASSSQSQALTAAEDVDAPDAPPFSADAIDAAARELPRMHSLLVSRRGDVLFERYYNGVHAGRPANIKSASKSVVSALVGIAVDRKLIPAVDTPIVNYFAELARDPDPRKQLITVEDLLTMRSGLEGTSNRNYGAWVLSRNWVDHALARPMFAAPGEIMEYSTGNTHLLSAILTRVAGASTWQFANDVLAKPLGFTLPQWPRDPQGIYFGGNDMLMTPRQLLAFGELYLNEGKASGRQPVSSSWIQRSCEGRRREYRPGERPGDRRVFDPARGFDPMRDRQYGYGWWVYQIDGHETCFAWGYGGQYVFVFPSLGVVVVTTASPDAGEERRGHRRQVFDILQQLVIRPLAARS
jgi:CubicO group peptidase (beta-lactamase class C family)